MDHCTRIIIFHLQSCVAKKTKIFCFLFIKKYVVGLVDTHISINFIELLMGKRDKEIGLIKYIKELDLPHMPKHESSGRGLGSPILSSR